MVGSDYIYPYESNRIMSDLILERGGEKVEEVYLPLDASAEDFVVIAKRIKDAQPSFIFSTVVGDSTALLHQAYAKVGLKPDKMPIASLTTSEAEVQQMGAHIAEGHITSAPYFQSLADAVNQRCVGNYKSRFGDEAGHQPVLGGCVLPAPHACRCHASRRLRQRIRSAARAARLIVRGAARHGAHRRAQTITLICGRAIGRANAADSSISSSRSSARCVPIRISSRTACRTGLRDRG
jgi:hypothetical protein